MAQGAESDSRSLNPTPTSAADAHQDIRKAIRDAIRLQRNANLRAVTDTGWKIKRKRNLAKQHSLTAAAPANMAARTSASTTTGTCGLYGKHNLHQSAKPRFLGTDRYFNCQVLKKRWFS